MPEKFCTIRQNLAHCERPFLVDSAGEIRLSTIYNARFFVDLQGHQR